MVKSLRETHAAKWSSSAGAAECVSVDALRAWECFCTLSDVLGNAMPIWNILHQIIMRTWVNLSRFLGSKFR